MNRLLGNGDVNSPFTRENYIGSADLLDKTSEIEKAKRHLLDGSKYKGWEAYSITQTIYLYDLPEFVCRFNEFYSYHLLDELSGIWASPYT